MTFDLAVRWVAWVNSPASEIQEVSEKWKILNSEYLYLKIRFLHLQICCNLIQSWDEIYS